MSNSDDLFSAFGESDEPSKTESATPENKSARPDTKKPSAMPAASKENLSYSAQDIEVLEGLEPVRRRPGMYIGGTDINALHHLFAEIIDNSMDEAIAGHASRIEVHLDAEGYLAITDNGRGIPRRGTPLNFRAAPRLRSS